MNESYKQMLATIDNGDGIATAAKIAGAIPTIHQIGPGEDAMIQTDSRARHAGFGFFESTVNGLALSFDGGGAMRHLVHGDTRLSWTPIRYDGDIGEVFDALACRNALVTWATEQGIA